jgi:hypothetical protein
VDREGEESEGLGDDATYSSAQGALRVLVGSTVFGVRVHRHPQPKEASVQAAVRAIAKLSSP